MEVEVYADLRHNILVIVVMHVGNLEIYTTVLLRGAALSVQCRSSIGYQPLALSIVCSSCWGHGKCRKYVAKHTAAPITSTGTHVESPDKAQKKCIMFYCTEQKSDREPSQCCSAHINQTEISRERLPHQRSASTSTRLVAEK